jgi:hypothetical protein
MRKLVVLVSVPVVSAKADTQNSRRFIIPFNEYRIRISNRYSLRINESEEECKGMLPIDPDTRINGAKRPAFEHTGKSGPILG